MCDSAAAFLYPQCDQLFSGVTEYVHHMETAAAGVEVVAAFGWAYTWWLTYPRTPGRGWTLDDPDVWGLIFIVVPSIVYMVYNIAIIRNPDEYGSNMLYQTGDVLYAIGAFAYLFGAVTKRAFTL